MVRFDDGRRAVTDGGRDLRELNRGSHVCILCYATFGEERDTCPECGSNLVCPWEERDSHETLRCLSGHGRHE